MDEGEAQVARGAVAVGHSKRRRKEGHVPPPLMSTPEEDTQPDVQVAGKVAEEDATMADATHGHDALPLAPRLKKPRVVGWASWEEWREVRKWLGSPIADERQRGLRRIRAWRARGPLPLAIESTAALLAAHGMDTYVV